MGQYLKIFLFLSFFSIYECKRNLTNNDEKADNNDVVPSHSIKEYLFWPNATIPFYIDPEHYDHEQALLIMTTLSLFAFKTCLRFLPVLVRPDDNTHVLLIENPNGVRKCDFDTNGHSVDEAHRLVLGYECLRSPEIDMQVMKALGFPFEHNRAIRDVYLDVQQENIEPGYIELFTMESQLPLELRALPYDINSVMHFGERAFSKNGHRTIIFRDHRTQQDRESLSTLDLRKIEIVYGPECRKRDRQEKIELCQYFPVSRRKREVELPDATKSLRVNPDITPPPSITNKVDDVSKSLQLLGIEDEVQEIVEQVNKVTALALQKARDKYCNKTKSDLRANVEVREKSTDILGIVESVAGYAQGMVDRALANLTEFCSSSQSLSAYVRASCPFFDASRCVNTNFRSTKSGPVKYSTQHRPLIRQSTKHQGSIIKHKNFDSQYLRALNDSESVTEVAKSSVADAKVESRRKRHAGPIPEDIIYITGVPYVHRRKREGLVHIPVNNVHFETKAPIVTTPNSVVNDGANVTKGAKLEAKGVNGDAKDVTDVKLEKPAAEAFEVEVLVGRDAVDNKDEVTVPSKSDLRMGKTRLVIDNSKWAPIDRRNMERRSFRSPGNGNQGRIEWDESNISMEEPRNMRPERAESRKGRYEERQELQGRSREERTSWLDKRGRPGGRMGSIGPREKDRRLSKVEMTSEFRDMGNERKLKAERDDSGEDEKEEKIKEDGSLEENTDPESPEVPVRPKRPNSKTKERKDKDEDEEETEKPSKFVMSGEKEEEEEVTTDVSSDYVPRTVDMTRKNKEFYDDRRWPDGLVRYVIAQSDKYDLDDIRSRLDEVNEILKRKTCVKLQEIRPSEANKFEDYLVLDTSPDYVTGRVGGKQNFGVVELFQGGQHRQHAAMMVMAMLGFYFEVSRHDRDKFIRVHQRHVRADKLHHFEKIRADATLHLPYDFRSATHPAWQFWRHIGKTGISTVATYKEKDPDGSVMKALGQHPQLLSELDLVKINSVYGTKCFRSTRRWSPPQNVTDQ